MIIKRNKRSSLTDGESSRKICDRDIQDYCPIEVRSNDPNRLSDNEKLRTVLESTITVKWYSRKFDTWKSLEVDRTICQGEKLHLQTSTITENIPHNREKI